MVALAIENIGRKPLSEFTATQWSGKIVHRNLNNFCATMNYLWGDMHAARLCRRALSDTLEVIGRIEAETVHGYVNGLLRSTNYKRPVVYSEFKIQPT